MKRLLKNGIVINVFTGETEQANVLIDDDKIIGVGDYCDEEADVTVDLNGKYICPGFIDGHIHIESTMLSPAEFARVCVPHGTTAVVADPHEIANVCGGAGIEYMLNVSEEIPLTVYTVLPSCVPSTKFCESGAKLNAEELDRFYSHPRVLGLGEVMSYPNVIQREHEIMEKIDRAKAYGRVVNGHAPLLTAKALDCYISAGIGDDHECSSLKEAKERIRKGQRVMIRQGTAARNLDALLPLFDEPWARRCMLVTDDKHPADLLQHGHIDEIIRSAVKAGKSPITGIQMATIQPAEYFGLKNVGAIAPGYIANIAVLDDLNSVSVCSVYYNGELVADNGKMLSDKIPDTSNESDKSIRNSFNMEELTVDDFKLNIFGKHKCRLISIVKNELITEELVQTVDFDTLNGIDIERDILKIAVIERHLQTGHIGLGFITGLGLKDGAIASSVSHDSHNLIIAGTNEHDMMVAGNHIRALGGGLVVVKDGKIVTQLALPLAGLMTDLSAEEISKQNEVLRNSVHDALGVPRDFEPFMTTAFVALPVIPHIKMTTHGLVDVDKQILVPLVVDEVE